MTNKIKVLMVGDLPLDLESVKGGVESAMLNLLSGFASLDSIDVAVLSFVDGLKNKLDVDFAHNIKIHFLPYKSRYRIVDYVINKSALKELITTEAPHIIHIQESGPHLLRFMGFSKNNMIVTQHGIMREEMKYAFGLRDKVKYLFKTFIEKFIFGRINNVIFISSYNKQLFRTNSGHVCARIYNSVNPIFFTHREGGKQSSNSIIYVGVINRRKNLALVIEALSELKKRKISYDLHVVGGYKEIGYESEIKECVNKHDLTDQIKFYGWLKQEEILEVYDQCAYFILPSQQETLPVSIAEAMALGKTVVATDVGAVSEMFDDNVTGFLFKKDDLQDLVTTLADLSGNSESTNNRQAEIKRVAIQKFHPDTNAKLTIDFYRMVLRVPN